MRIGGWIASIGAGVSAFASSAMAADIEPVRVVLVAHEGCPNAPQFFAQMRIRTSRVRWPNSGEPASVVKVEIKKTSDGRSSGTVMVPDGVGGTSVRTVVGSECGEVASALSFIAALAFDPNAGSPAPSVETKETADDEDEDTQPTTPPSIRGKFKGRTPGVLATPDELAKTFEVPSTKWNLSLVGGVGFRFSTPSPTTFTAAFLELGWDRRGTFAPALRVGFVRSLATAFDAPVGQANFRWTLGTLDACPVRWRPIETMALRPCVGLEAGALEANGEGLDSNLRQVRAWIAARAAAAFTWTFVEVLRLDLAAGFTVPFRRDDFRLNDDRPVWRAPAVWPLVELALGVRFS